jgi:hypothetical protein
VLSLVPVNRYVQVVIWVLLTPVFGVIQGAAGSLFVMLEHGDLGNPDLHRLLTGLALIYGGGWFLPALLISDFLFLRRTLSRREIARYASFITMVAILLGLLMPGVMVMIGYPMTAVAILGCGFLHRKRQHSPELGVETE